MIIAVDFDHVIHDTANPKPGRRMGPPMVGALNTILELLANKNTIFVHTCMANNPAGRKAVEDWLAYYGFPEMEIVGKPHADVYIDDKALRFENWDCALDDMGV